MRPSIVLRPAGLLLALLVASPLPAQLRSSVEPGDRVRIVGEEGQAFRGTVSEVRGDTLHLVGGTPSGQGYVDVRAVQSVDVSTGRRGRTLLGAGIGALVGVGAVVLAEPRGNCSEDEEGHRAVGCAFVEGLVEAMAVVIFPTLGLLTGGVVGTFIRTDRWETVARGPSPVVSVSRDGVAIGFKLPL